LIINRYINLEILKPLALISLILIAIFTSFSSAAYLADAAHGLLTGATVIKLTLLKTVIGLEALLPTALYLAIVVGLGRLYSDSEMTVLSATGFSELQLVKAILPLAVVVAVIVGLLTLYIRPWAYQASYRIQARSLAQLDINKLEAGRFYPLGQTKSVLFTAGISRKNNRLEQVFFQDRQGERSRVIRAREAYFTASAEETVPVMIFVDGYAYDMDADTAPLSLSFKILKLSISNFSSDGQGYKRKAVPLARLRHSTHPGDIAEYQWRLSMPLITIILGLLAIPLSRSRPRQGRYARLFAALLIYALYYNLASLGRTWVDQGRVAAIPGIWWVHLIPLIILVLMLSHPYLKHRWGTNKRASLPASAEP